MSQVEYFAERSFAIKGTLVFTAQRDQFTIMEDAYLVCDGKKVAGTYSALPEQYRQIKVLDASGKFVIPGTCDIHVHASQAPFQGIGQNIENGQWNTWFDCVFEIRNKHIGFVPLIIYRETKLYAL